VTVLDGVDLQIVGGEFLTLLGASGSGKTTLLRIVGGLVKPSEGRILLGARDITALPPERRDIGFVFQNYALFPHLTVAENVAFAMKVRRIAREEAASRVEEALRLVGLTDLARRYPGQLSGGQQQRVALARAIVFRPGVLLLDEPLGALDRQLRQQLAFELRQLQRQSGITMVYVTHDQEEAFTMSTQVAIMHNGTIQQMAAPHEIYTNPANLMVARFVGDLNSLPGRIRGSDGVTTAVSTDAGTITSENGSGHLPGATVLCAVRPEHVRVLAGSDQSPLNTLTARVGTVIFGGSWHRIELELQPGGAVIRSEGRGQPEGINEGDEVRITFDPKRVMIFNAEQGSS
jgi:ABC-type Fe3+/spermidine/putrescine transport system ATPase subunit